MTLKSLLKKHHPPSNAVNHLNNQKGFTLVELIVVVAILSILALIAIMRMGGFTAVAQDRTDRSNARILTTIAQAYHASPENNNAWPWDEDPHDFTEISSEHGRIGSYLSETIKIQKVGNVFRFAEGRVTIAAADLSGDDGTGNGGGGGSGDGEGNNSGGNGTGGSNGGDAPSSKDVLMGHFDSHFDNNGNTFNESTRRLELPSKISDLDGIKWSADGTPASFSLNQDQTELFLEMPSNPGVGNRLLGVLVATIGEGDDAETVSFNVITEKSQAGGSPTYRFEINSD